MMKLLPTYSTMAFILIEEFFTNQHIFLNFAGRYDTPDHELYSTLTAEHENDFYNCFVKQPQALVGPREPWHDIHSKVEGPIAQDVFTNFYERWRKQCRNEIRLDPLDPKIFDVNWLPPFTG